jgi:hypothetical protein
MKWKLFTRRMSVSAPKMTVKRHVPWPLRLAMWATAIVVCGFGGIGIWQATVGSGAQEREKQQAELAQLNDKLVALEKERAELAALAKSADSRLQIEKSTAERLSAQTRSLEQENAKLKADLAYMEGLLPTAGADGPTVALRQFEVMPDVVPGQYRYRALLVQGGREQREFTGTTQLHISSAASGSTKAVSISLPAPQDKAAQERMQVKFKRYLRIEGSFEVPKEFQPKTVQLRVLEQGTLRAQSQASL